MTTEGLTLAAMLPAAPGSTLADAVGAAARGGADAVIVQLGGAGDRSAQLPFELADFETGADPVVPLVSGDDLATIAAACREHALALVVSVSDDEGLRVALDAQPMALHVPPAALGDLVFIATAATGRAVWLDTAMANVDEVAEAVAAVQKAGGQPSLLHGLVTVAGPPEEQNLNALATLRDRFDVPVGWAARDVAPALAVAAVALGACVLVVPFGASGEGFDAAALGQLKADAGLVARALGDGAKRVQPSEWPARDRLHRSLVARVPIARGEALTADMLATARPGLGLKPRLIDAILGRRAALDVPAGTVLTLGMLQ